MLKWTGTGGPGYESGLQIPSLNRDSEIRENTTPSTFSETERRSPSQINKIILYSQFTIRSQKRNRATIMTIPTTVAASTEEDASLAQLDAEDAEEPITIALGTPGPVEGLTQKLILLFTKPPNENDSDYFPPDLRNCPVISPTRPEELTNLPQETWTEFHNEMEEAAKKPPWFGGFMCATFLAAFVVICLVVFSILPWIAMVAVVGLILCFGVAICRQNRKTEKLRSELVDEFGSRFEAAGYHVSTQRFCLEIQPLATNAGVLCRSP